MWDNILSLISPFRWLFLLTNLETPYHKSPFARLFLFGSQASLHYLDLVQLANHLDRCGSKTC
uniref:Uncharacterized protein n=1 Tax=Cannabis sativa TaxID=3483 RepID=A0A803RAX5_CANSA